MLLLNYFIFEELLLACYAILRLFQKFGQVCLFPKDIANDKHHCLVQ